MYKEVKVFSLSLASGATLTSDPVDVGWGFNQIFLEVPTMASGSLFIKASNSRSGIYRRVTHPAVNTSTVQNNDYSINSTTTQKMVPIPGGFQFYKVESTSGATDTTTTFNFICSTGA